MVIKDGDALFWNFDRPAAEIFKHSCHGVINMLRGCAALCCFHRNSCYLTERHQVGVREIWHCWCNDKLKECVRSFLEAALVCVCMT
jgi:hypothetical protein